MTEYQTFGQLCSDKKSVEEYLKRKTLDKLNEIERLREENARLREALKPFAELKPVSWSLESDHYFIDTADIHTARVAIREGEK